MALAERENCDELNMKKYNQPTPASGSILLSVLSKYTGDPFSKGRDTPAGQ